MEEQLSGLRYGLFEWLVTPFWFDERPEHLPEGTSTLEL